MNALNPTLKVGAIVLTECSSGCSCTEQDNCGASGKIGTLAYINEHNEDGDFYGVSFPGQERLVYFWAHELQVWTSIKVVNEQQAEPVCQRMGCPVQSPYNQATRRCTLEIVSGVVVCLPTELNGLMFSADRWVTVDLCIACYHLIKHDETVRYLSTALIEERQVQQ